MSHEVTGRTLHVSAQATTLGNGSKEAPFRTIQQAADIAVPGDRVVVHEGTYREEVDPRNGGYTQYEPIVYEAAEGKHPVIKGSEVISDWDKVDGTLWHASVPNDVFGKYNPFATKMEGDWLEQPHTWKLTLGEVYVNGKAMYQAESLDAARAAKKRETAPGPAWIDPVEPLLHPEDSVYQWYAEVREATTEIWANFQGLHPDQELVEINVRRSCFYPSKTGRDYITVRGFEMAQAATPWAPPTANQIGLIGPNWAKGWVIEDNRIHDAKCSAVSLGKEYTTGDEDSFYGGCKPGYQFQLEATFLAHHRGWDRETVGSHIVRNNRIYDCGQNGIVGNLGCIFSTIEGNDIYNIGVKHEFFGHEIGAIKLHAPIDVVIRHNKLHSSALGMWLDWQAQGTRISSNLFYDNLRDFMIEVTHGPCVVDNNIFASQHSVDNHAQGTAYLHNLFLGSWTRKRIVNRFTPYHLPHSTEVLGTACVYSGDDRFYQNIFVGGDFLLSDESFRGTATFDGAPVSEQEFVRLVHGEEADPHIGDISLFEKVDQPVFINDNVYLGGAPAFGREATKVVDAADPKISVTQDSDGSVWLEGDFPQGLFEMPTEIRGTANLGRPRLVGEHYENADGSPLDIGRDLLGNQRGTRPVPGPVELEHAGRNRIRLA